MKSINRLLAGCAVLSLSFGAAHAADSYSDTVSVFKHAGQSAAFFRKSYAYAVFPSIGEGAFIVGGGYGTGHVYVHGKWVGDASLTEVSVGFQAGGKAFSQIVFFRDKRALDEFESGSFEFGADASVVAITAGANASTGTSGSEAGASGGMRDAVLHGEFYKGMAVFTIPKGGLMGSVSVAGEKFKYTPRQNS
jgi:lipid-binding SYLF domain-containing protein